MIAFLKSLWRDRRGNALVIAAAALPLVLGSAGLASDTIEWALWKRQLQRAADSAAMAGVYAKVQSQNYTDAVNADLTHNNHVGITTAVTPNSPPPSGAYASDPMAVRVSLAVQKRLSFSSLFIPTAPTIRASATATIVPSGQYCVISLENTAASGITVIGNANLNLGCGMITNSTALNAALATGSSTVTASPIAAVGGIQPSSNWASGTVLQPFTVAQDDPFANVNPTAPSGACMNDPRPTPADTTILVPGCYRGLTLKGNVTLQPGEYYIDGGDVHINSGANVTGDGVTLILSNRDTASNATIGQFDLNGGATISLTAPGTGTYAGIVLYQDRRATNMAGNKINGNSSSSFQGAFYLPQQEVEFTGNAGMNTSCLRLVARRVQFAGNSSIANSCSVGSGVPTFEGKRVRLVE